MQKEKTSNNDTEYVIGSQLHNQNKTKYFYIPFTLLLSSSIMLFPNRIPRTINGDNSSIIAYGSNTGINNYYLGEVADYTSITNMDIMDLKKMDNLRKIEHMKKFEFDWNGNEGLPFSDEAITIFMSIINNVTKQPVISPTGRESLVIQYELDDMSYLGFEIFVNKVSKVYIPKRDYDQAVEEEFTENFLEQINTNVEWFYGRKYYS